MLVYAIKLSIYFYLSLLLNYDFFSKVFLKHNFFFLSFMLLEKISKKVFYFLCFEDIKDIQGLRKYTIVVVTNDIYVEEIV